MIIRRFFPLIALSALLFCLPVRAQSFQFLDDEAEPAGYDVTAQIAKAPAEFLLSKGENGDGYDLKITPTGLQFFVTRAKKAPQLLAQKSVKSKFPASFVAQRRGARWRFILNGQTALEAEDDSFSVGQIGTKGAIKDARVQPIEPIRFDDDFMRVASEVALKDALANPRAGVKIQGLQLQESIWSVAAGRFATTGLTENTEAQVAQSANPFAFRALDAGLNLALTGRPFWNDYSSQISIQPQGSGEIGVLVYAQNPKNYLGMFWSDKNGPELRAVVDGKAKILDRASAFGPFEINQWNRWRLDIAGGQLRGFIDDTEVLRARTGLFGRGQLGIAARLASAGDDKKAEGALFDDANVRSIGDFYDDFSQEVPGRWTTIAGQWNLTEAAKSQGARGAFAVMGEPDWKEYRAAANLNVPRGGSAGLLLHHLAGKGAYLLRVQKSAQGAGKAQIALLSGGKTKIIGEKTLSQRQNVPNQRWSFEAKDGYLSAKIEGELVVDAFDTSLSVGRAGITAQNGQSIARITDFSVEWPQAGSNWAKVPELFEVETQAQTMGGWSTPQGFWIARPGEKGAAPTNAVWHKGEFFGDEDVAFTLPDLSGDKTTTLLFAGRNGAKFTLNLSQKDDFKAILSDGKRSWNGAAKLAAGARLTIARRGTFFIVRSGETVVLAARV